VRLFQVKYHNFSKRGYDIFQGCKTNDSIPTLLTFTLPYDGAFGYDRYIELTAKRYEEKCGVTGEKVGERTYKFLLSKHQIQNLLDDPLISDIDIPDTSKVKAIPLADFSNQYQVQPQPDIGNSATVNAWYFTNSGYAGNNVNVSIMEPQPMLPSYLSTWFNFPAQSYTVRSTSS